MYKKGILNGVKPVLIYLFYIIPINNRMASLNQLLKRFAFLPEYVQRLILWSMGARGEKCSIHSRDSGFTPSDPLASVLIVHSPLMSDPTLTIITCTYRGDQITTSPVLRMWGG